MLNNTTSGIGPPGIPEDQPQKPNIQVTENAATSSAKPPKAFLENVKGLQDKRFRESKKVVDEKKRDWEKFRDMYNNVIKDRTWSWESNLVIPKSYYIVQTMTPWILSAIFNVADFVTLKSPRIREDELIRMGKWFTWFMLRKMHLYLKYVELFTDSPIVGTSLLKLSSQNGIPSADFLKIDDFYPDPRSRKPGDIDNMLFCFHRFGRDFGQLEQARTLRTRMLTVTESTSEGMIPEEKQIPQLVDEPLYFNLKDVWKKHVQQDSTTKVPVSTALSTGTETEERQVNLPELDLIEHWGEIETTFGVYDVNAKNYRPGKYEEYVVTSVLANDNTLDDIIRCEPSSLYYQDQLENRRKYIKPFVSSLYSIVPGQFYGKGVLEPIESLITEQKEHHDLYLDEHKRSVMTILSVLERSGLTPRDLAFTPYGHWIMRSHEDVKPIKFPEVNLQAFSMIHGLLDREIDRTSGSSAQMQGVATTKRQTMGEVQSLMAESTRRFSLFIKMADHLTLRPTAFKTMLLMRFMPTIQQGHTFSLPDEDITIDPESLAEEIEFAFAATGVEPEYTKYAKQDMFPRLLKELSNAAKASDGKYIPNMSEIANELTQLYNFKDAERFMEERRPSIPVDLLKAAAGGHSKNPQENQALIQALQQIMENAKILQEAEEEEAKEKRGRKPS
ncbi:hypothetical protein LCGC14_0671760 [marine sediment metagenome]|uniref:Uncharacterized protein n=1 Tax=marine sediment metagenome TaxID=412755 RepID=A0A0F9QQU1_9ZZZZ|nr:hypothetical protein [Candidatus Aminicenantes bacterium]